MGSFTLLYMMALYLKNLYNLPLVKRYLKIMELTVQNQKMILKRPGILLFGSAIFTSSHTTSLKKRRNPKIPPIIYLVNNYTFLLDMDHFSICSCNSFHHRFTHSRVWVYRF